MTTANNDEFLRIPVTMLTFSSLVWRNPAFNTCIIFFQVSRLWMFSIHVTPCVIYNCYNILLYNFKEMFKMFDTKLAGFKKILFSRNTFLVYNYEAFETRELNLAMVLVLLRNYFIILTMAVSFMNI